MSWKASMALEALRKLVTSSPRYDLILASGLFQADAYRARYMQGKGDADDPLVHYLAGGEARGNRPNAFFDPFHLAEVTGTKSLYRYLREPRLWSLPCSSDFDGNFYRASLPVERRKTQPLVDFWQAGFEQQIRPSTRFDTRFFMRAVSRDVWDKKAFAFAALTGSRPPCTPDQLAQCQARFYAMAELEVLAESAGPVRPNLVFVQCSRDYPARLAAKERSYDLLLNFYDGSSLHAAHVEIATRQKGTKVTAIRKILEERPDLLLRYERVLFLDDDVEIAPDSVERVFDAMSVHGLDLAQPSLSARSISYFQDLKQPKAGDGLTWMTSVEIMMPALSRRALERCGWVFSTGVSGWAVDFLLGAEIRRTLGTRPALVGQSVAEHLKPYDVEGGTFYRFLKSHGVDPNIEAGAIAIKYDVDDSARAISALEPA